MRYRSFQLIAALGVSIVLGTSAIHSQQRVLVTGAFSFFHVWWSIVDGRMVFSIHASSDPDGSNVSGQIIYGSGDEAEVRCLLVAGNRALVGAEVTQSAITPLGTTLFFVVEDNGSPGRGHDKAGAFGSYESASDCLAQQALLQISWGSTIEAGNITVR